jgi:two-component system sensor histidine kinase YesM
LVENFLKHGYDRKLPLNLITVKCYVADDRIWIDVRDNGIGIRPDLVHTIHSLNHRSEANESREGAMSNIHERLSIHFGEGYGLEIVEHSGAGGWIRLKIPYAESNGGEDLE